jgi:hypothetical protein
MTPLAATIIASAIQIDLFVMAGTRYHTAPGRSHRRAPMLCFTALTISASLASRRQQSGAHDMSVVDVAAVPIGFTERRQTADRIFRAALLFNAALTAFWVIVYAAGVKTIFFSQYAVTRAGLMRVAFGFLVFSVLWGFIWFGVKNLLLKYFVGLSKDERRQAFSARMDGTYDVASLVARYSERRIRIADMIGRRGRFITLASAGFYYLYATQRANPTPSFVTGFTQYNLFDAVIGGWMFLAFYYSNGHIAAMVYGPQSRIMDGVLARANNLLITTLWSVFKFVLVPIGARLARLYQPGEFAVVFALIWGSYIACDACTEIGGSLFGRQTIRVWGIGDINRKSIEGTVCGFIGSLALCLWVVLGRSLPPQWIALAVIIAVSNTVLELCSPRGTDDLTMATANALICLAYGAMR